MLNNVKYNIPGERHVHLSTKKFMYISRCRRDRETYIMPRHTRALDNTECIPCEPVDVLEVKNSRIVVVLTGEERRRKVGWVHVRERVRVGVPAAETKVKSTDARAVIIDDNYL